MRDVGFAGEGIGNGAGVAVPAVKAAERTDEPNAIGVAQHIAAHDAYGRWGVNLEGGGHCD